MTSRLRYNTSADVVVGPFVDDTDGKTPETALTIVQADCQLIKDAGAAAQKNSATAASHLGGGHYKIPLSGTDTNQTGSLRLFINKSGALPVWRDFEVVVANEADSSFSGDLRQVHMAEISNNLLTAAALADDAAEKVAAAVWDEALSAHLTTGSTGDALNDAGSVTPVSVADAVWDEALAGHATAGSTGEALASAAAGGGASAGDIADAVWDEVLAGHQTTGSAGAALQDAADGDYVAGSSGAALNAKRGYEGLVRGSAVTGVLSTTAFSTSLTETTNGHYNDRILTFTTGPLAGQATQILGYNGSTKVLTVAAMTEAPANGNEFIIQ